MTKSVCVWEYTLRGLFKPFKQPKNTKEGWRRGVSFWSGNKIKLIKCTTVQTTIPIGIQVTSWLQIIENQNILKDENDWSKLMRLWCLSHRRTAKAQARLRGYSEGSCETAWIASLTKIRRVAQVDCSACVFEDWFYGGQINAIISWVGSKWFLFLLIFKNINLSACCDWMLKRRSGERCVLLSLIIVGQGHVVGVSCWNWL